MSLFDDMKTDYQEKLSENGRVEIPVSFSNEKLYVYRTVTGNRKNRILVAQKEGGLFFAATVLINTLRKEDGEYALKNVTVNKLLNETDSVAIDAIAAEIIPVIFAENDDGELVPNDENPALDIAAGNSPTAKKS